jgi:hypothetical protein
MNNEERVSLANSYIVGYAKDFITDEECNDMIDLALNKTSIVNDEGIIWDNTFDEESFHTQFSESMIEFERDIVGVQKNMDVAEEFISAWTQEDCNEFIEVGCSAALDNEWANESI